MQAHLKLIEANSKVLSPALVENTAELQKWAQERNGLRSLFSDIFVISAKGVVLVDVPARDRRGIDVSDREYFRTTVETRRPYISKPYIGRANKIPQVSFSGPVFDQRGAVVAVVTGSLDLLQPNFLGNLAESKVGEKGFFGLFTRERLLIVSRDRSRIMTQGPAAGESPYFDRAVSGQDGSEEAVNSRGLNAIFSYSQLQAAPWVLVSVLPVDEAYAPIRSAQQHIIIATLFLGLLIAPLVWLAVRRFYDPLRRALGEQEVGLHRAQALAKLSHVITGPDGEFESWPETLPRMIGRQPAEMPRNTREWLETVHPEDREKLRATAIAAGRSSKRLEVEYRLQRGDSSWIRIRQVSEPLDSTPGATGARRWIGTMQDVTEQQRMVHDLLASEERYRVIFEQAAVGVVHSAVQGRILNVNPKFCAMSGYPREEAVSIDIRDVIHPDDVETCLEGRAGLLAGTGLPYEREARLIRKDGTEYWANIITSLVKSEPGQSGHFVSIVYDISARKLAEEGIKRLNRVYAVLSGINALIVRAQDRNELYRESCRIAVEHGGFGMAWIGELDRATLDVTPVAWYGMDESAVSMKATARDDIPAGQGMVGRAIRGKVPVITNDINADPGAGGPRRAEALRKGFHSIIAMPIMVDDEVRATLTLFARERNFFSEDELKLLTELAGDISFALDHIEKAEKLDYLAYYDSLTGLANRSLFQERVSQYLHAAQQVKGKVGLVLADVERFKTINDSLGRQAGDDLLKQLAERLGRAAQPANIARLGGDHFAIVLPGARGRSEMARTVEGILQDCFAQSFRINGTELRVAAKAGIAHFPSDGADVEALFASAEAALKKAQQTGERYLFHTQELTAGAAGQLELETRLRQALEKGEFVLHYQPKVELQTRQIVGVEALIRWQNPELGLVPPLKFIPLMEETGLILEVGAWALSQAVADHSHWLAQGLSAPRIAVNVSAIQLRRRDFVASVERALKGGATPPGIDLEITESLLMEDVDASIQKLKEIRKLGLSIAIDDFGTGYSSLAYLAKLPLATLKIDRAFVITMLDDPDTATLVQMMISLAHGLKLMVVAEGVETEDQARILRLLRCDQMQGYLFSKPLPLDAMTALLQKTKV
ncbi:MAG TPA: EAL domain-containing protein [Burkholderiales bacterium]